jgi:predicted transposase/invertase (TIGR01784 family)
LIEEIEYLPAEQTPRIPEMKRTIVDVKCTDRSGRIFIVEMQLFGTDSFKHRLLYGTAKAFVQQLKKGWEYHELCHVYGLGIVNTIFERDTDEWFHHYKLVNMNDPEKILDPIQLVFLELPKFKPQTFFERKMGVLWLRFLKEIGENAFEVPKEFSDVPEITKAMEIAQESSFTPAELEAYDRYWDAVSIEKTVRKDGVIEGKAEGKAEEKIEVVKKMLRANMEIALIAQITGFSKAEIKKYSEK